MIQLRAPYTAPILRRSATLVRTGVEPDVWVVVSTKVSREDQDKKQAIPVGSIVRFTVQYGWRAGKEDNTNLAVLSGEVILGRTALLPDSYTVRMTEVHLTHDLDPSVSTPPVGQVFLIAPWSIASIVKAAPASTTEPFAAETLAPEPSPDAKVVRPSELTGTTPQTSTAPPPDSSSSNVVLYAGLGVVLLFGLGAWWMAA